MDQDRIQSLLTDLFLASFPPGVRSRPLALYGAPRQLPLIVRFLEALWLSPQRILLSDPKGAPAREGLPVVRADAYTVKGVFILVLSTDSYQAIAARLQGFGLRPGEDFASFFDCFERSTRPDPFAHFARTAKELIHITEELHPWYINTSAARNVRGFLAAARALKGAGASFAGQKVLEIGCGNTLVPALMCVLFGAAKVTTLDIVAQKNLYHPSQYGELIAFVASHFDELPLAGLTPGQAVDLLLGVLGLKDGRIDPDPGRIEIRVPADIASVASEQDRYGISFSTVVFEHFQHPGEAVAALAQASAPGAYGFHQIDLCGHQGEQGGLPRFYHMSREACRAQYPTLGVNTLRKSEFEALFTRNGFTVLHSHVSLALDPLTIDRAALHPDFAAMSQEDLASLYVTMLVRKR